MTPEEKEAYSDYNADQENLREQEIQAYLAEHNLREVRHDAPIQRRTVRRPVRSRPVEIGRYGAPAQYEDRFMAPAPQQISTDVMAQIMAQQQAIMAQQQAQQPVEQPYNPTSDQKNFPSYFLQQDNDSKTGKGGGGIGASQYLFGGTSAIAGVSKKNRSAFSVLFEKSGRW